MYSSNSAVSVEIEGDYKATLDWGYAPYLRIKGLEAGTVAAIRAEVYRE